MAVNNTAKSYANMEFPLAMKRQDAFALDGTSVWPSLAAAQEYAQSNPTAYVGQVISVVVDGTATVYQIKNAAGDLEPLGTGDLEGDMDALLAAKVATDAEINAAIGEIYTDEETV